MTRTLPQPSTFLAMMMMINCQLLRSTLRSSDGFTVLATSISSPLSSPQDHVRHHHQHHHHRSQPPNDQNISVTSWRALERRTRKEDMVPRRVATFTSSYGRFLQLEDVTNNNETQQCTAVFYQCFNDTTKSLSTGTCDLGGQKNDQYWCGTFCCAPQASDCCHTPPGLTVLAIFLWLVIIAAVVLTSCYCCRCCHGYDYLHGRRRGEAASLTPAVEMTLAPVLPHGPDPAAYPHMAPRRMRIRIHRNRPGSRAMESGCPKPQSCIPPTICAKLGMPNELCMFSFLTIG